MLNSFHPGLLRAAAQRTRCLLQASNSSVSSGGNSSSSYGGSDAVDGGDGVQPSATAPEQHRHQLGAYDGVALLWAFGVLQHVDEDLVRRLGR
mgnify:CR=1 FL=1